MALRLGARLALTLAIGLATASRAGADEASAIEAGRQIAVAVCAKCHVVAEGLPVPVLRPPAPGFPDIAAAPEATEETLRAFLGRPHGDQRRLSAMPPFVLSPSQTDAVLAYLLSLKRK